jgi:hypothetical protein
VGDKLKDGEGHAFIQRVKAERKDGAKNDYPRGGGCVLIKLIGLIGEKCLAAEPMPLFLVLMNQQTEDRAKGQGEQELDN